MLRHAERQAVEFRLHDHLAAQPARIRAFGREVECHQLEVARRARDLHEEEAQRTAKEGGPPAEDTNGHDHHNR